MLLSNDLTLSFSLTTLCLLHRPSLPLQDWMWPHSHHEGPCSVSPEGIINWHGCSLGAVGGIPLESGGFEERYILLQRACDFPGVNQAFLKNHCVIMDSEGNMGASLVRNLLELKWKSSPWPVGPMEPAAHYLSHSISWLSLHHALTITSSSSVFLYTRNWVPLPIFPLAIISIWDTFLPDSHLL